MLNYIWGGLIIFALVFALYGDIRDISEDSYRNEQPLPVQLEYPEGYQAGARRVPVEIRIDPQQYREFYNVDATPDSTYGGYVVRTQRGNQLRFEADASLPAPLGRIQEYSASADDELQGVLGEEQLLADSTLAQTTIVFNPVKFARLDDITQAAFDFAETAAELALGLIGVLALFLGLLQIAEAGGLIHQLVRVTQPVFRPLFPEIPDGHPALGMIVLNLTANILGLGNAATPLGIKAMEELQELNPSKETATNSMVMLLAMNTASVQLVPPTLLVAVMGLQVNELILPIILVTGMSLIIAVTSAKFFQRMPGFRSSDPNLTAAGAESATETDKPTGPDEPTGPSDTQRGTADDSDEPSSTNNPDE